MNKTILLLATLSALSAAVSCSESTDPVIDPTPAPTPEKAQIPIRIASTFPSTKATDSAFESGDAVGVYVVNYSNGAAGALATSGNHMDNVKYTYNGSAWSADKEYYWKDESTHADFYCIYPYDAAIASTSAYAVKTAQDQSTSAAYRSSDILWGKTADAAPSESAVGIQVNHIFGLLDITIQPGTGFTEATLRENFKSLTINGVQVNGTLDVATGNVTAIGAKVDMTPLQNGLEFKALVVPQTITDARFITLVVGSYTYYSNQSVTFKSHYRKSCTFTVNRVSEGINITIGGWTDDTEDYGATLN